MSERESAEPSVAVMASGRGGMERDSVFFKGMVNKSLNKFR